MKRRIFNFAALIITLIILVGHLAAPMVPITQEPVFHMAAAEFVLTARVIGNTVDLEWTQQPGVELYNILYGKADSLELDLIDITPSFSISLTPFEEGNYAIEAETDLGFERTNTVLIEK
jgi:hypothetical protein